MVTFLASVAASVDNNAMTLGLFRVTADALLPLARMLCENSSSVPDFPIRPGSSVSQRLAPPRDNTTRADPSPLQRVFYRKNTGISGTNLSHVVRFCSQLRI
jgi:hypothetical protein